MHGKARAYRLPPKPSFSVRDEMMTGSLQDMAADVQARIREVAYLMWESAGRQHGMAVEYWLAAEREVINFMQAATGRIALAGSSKEAEAQPETSAATAVPTASAPSPAAVEPPAKTISSEASSAEASPAEKSPSAAPATSPAAAKPAATKSDAAVSEPATAKPAAAKSATATAKPAAAKPARRTTRSKAKQVES